MNRTQLQVLICTYGQEGIRRVAAGTHPRVEGVEYVVSWQLPRGEAVVPGAIGRREDFKVVVTHSIGLTRNRNEALRLATAPIVLIADDDLNHKASGLIGIMEEFDAHPDYDFMTFRFETDVAEKIYPELEFDFPDVPENFYVSSCEIAFRTSKVKDRFRFNENFGVNALFCAGEEDIFIHDIIKGGLRGRYAPIVIAEHPGPTTAFRADKDRLIEAKGAVFVHIKGWRWPAYMLAHALRQSGNVISRKIFSYCRWWIGGVRRARIHKVFD